MSDRINKWRAKRLKAGLCIECVRSVEPSYSRCIYHLLKDKLSSKKYRSKNRINYNKKERIRKHKRTENNQCLHCGRALQENSNQVCIICDANRKNQTKSSATRGLIIRKRNRRLQQYEYNTNIST